MIMDHNRNLYQLGYEDARAGLYRYEFADKPERDPEAEAYYRGVNDYRKDHRTPEQIRKDTQAAIKDGFAALFGFLAIITLVPLGLVLAYWGISALVTLSVPTLLAIIIVLLVLK